MAKPLRFSIFLLLGILAGGCAIERKIATEGSDQQASRQPQGITKPATMEGGLSRNRQSPYFDLSEPVGMLTVHYANGTKQQCTAAIISDSEIITAHHCIPSGELQASLKKIVRVAVLERGFYEHKIERSYQVNRQPEYSSADLDFSIVRVFDNPAKRYGSVKLSSRKVPPGAKLILIHHPDGLPKQLARAPACRAGTRSADKAHMLLHTCDTIGGSSGAPVFLANTKQVVAIHTGGFKIRENHEFNEGTLVAAVAKLLGPSFARFEDYQDSAIAAGLARTRGQGARSEYRTRIRADGNIVFRKTGDEAGTAREEVLLNGSLAKAVEEVGPEVASEAPVQSGEVSVIRSRISSDYDQNGNLLSPRERECLDYAEAGILNSNVGLVVPREDCESFYSAQDIGMGRFEPYPSSSGRMYMANTRTRPKFIYDLGTGGMTMGMPGGMSYNLDSGEITVGVPGGASYNLDTGGITMGMPGGMSYDLDSGEITMEVPGGMSYNRPSGLPDTGWDAAPDLGRYGVPDMGRYGVPDVGRYGVPDVGRYGVPDMGRYGVPDMGRYGVPYVDW